MRRKSVAILIGVLVVVAFTASACEVSVSTANISEAWTSADEAGDERTTVFAQDQDFYVQVQLKNAPDDTTLKATWTAVDVEDADPNLLIDEVELTAGDGQHQFSLTNDSLWPLGSYKVDLYLNAELAQTVEFEVQ
ncbi:MAG: hypothetical protein KKA32_04785 [Actinobacteria bacterium]|nr:hypothetical protein [Actinomycetota bacterium]